jgi:alpha-aminoadipate carrier protein LysW
MSMRAVCSSCGAVINVPVDVLSGEVVSCPDRGSQYEVKVEGNIITLVEAELPDESWGE